jgi:APA family basic amino acid/polyamine antiporter
MENRWRGKPGDRVLRPPRLRRPRLRRVLGVPALFSAAYGNVGSSIYYALGIVALVALGATPIAMVIAGILFIFTALSYAEGTAMFPESGGSASFARHGFNDLIGFISGWALMLSYIVTIAISAYTISPYLGYFWEPLKDNPMIGTAISMGVILLLMTINVSGVRESSRVNIFFTFVDLATQVSIIILGALLIPNLLGNLELHMFGEGNWPSMGNLIYAVALAALAYTGVETVSQMAGETRHAQARAPKALMWMTITVLIIFAGVSIVALSAMPPGELAGEWARDPIAGIAFHLPEALQSIYQPLIAVLAASILLIATNAGVLGISRLAFSLGENHQLPSNLSRLHPRSGTPYISIALFGLIALLILIPGFFIQNFFADLGALYVFGSLLSFTLAHLSILALRIKQPLKHRPFKIPLNIRTKGYDLPLTSIIGLIATFAIWVIIVATEPYSRGIGFIWMLIGFLIYYFYRRRVNLPLTHSVKVTRIP